MSPLMGFDIREACIPVKKEKKKKKGERWGE
jgi:hypothetical protein